MKRDAIKAYYEREGRKLTAFDIDKDYRGMFRFYSTHGPRRLTLEKWLDSAKRNETFLDVGCELGYFVRKMALRGLVATGVDISQIKVHKAQFIAKKLDIKCKFLQMDAEHLEFTNNSFDWVLCSETLEHVIDDRQAIAELIRVSRRNILITVPQKSLFWRILNRIRPIYGFKLGNAGHLREYVLNRLLELVGNQVIVKKIKYCSFFSVLTDPFLSKLPIFRALLCIYLIKKE
ncbi:MAG: class I SAM-dependent methyltransferase [Candidatus Helarchaeota archaeon]